MTSFIRQNGAIAALLAALLFGAGTPLAKALLAHVSPWMLAALLYLGSGLGLWLMRLVMRAPKQTLAAKDRRWLGGAIAAGGVIAPVLLMLGLQAMPAAGASLLLNAEGVFTALLAWFVFKEHFQRRIAIGMVAIVLGALVLSLPQASFTGAWAELARLEWSSVWPPLAVLGACFAWGLDNNLTRKVALSDASYIAMLKGLIAGATNLVLALATASAWPDMGVAGSALLLGFASYGASLTLFVIALRHLGTARTGAYFSVAPFFGATLAVLMFSEPVTPQLVLAGLLMAVGVWLHLSEQHAHAHAHEVLAHEHEHVHDEHHQHEHEASLPAGTQHSHRHVHEGLTHTHAHFPDAHHRHKH